LNLNSDFVSELFEDDLDVRKIDIQFVDERSVKKVNQIVQNYPNPFIDQTTISFELKEAGAVNYQIYSMDGMLLKNDSIEMKKGNNSIEILSETIVNSGIYYVKIEAEQWESTVKIIKLE